jgi:hypothetical protein
MHDDVDWNYYSKKNDNVFYVDILLLLPILFLYFDEIVVDFGVKRVKN